jgi:hypothetical protein
MTSSPQIPSLVIQRIEQLKDENVALLAENARLREALEPFAKVAAVYHESTTDSLTVWGGMDSEQVYHTLALGDCRRARAALEAKP